MAAAATTATFALLIVVELSGSESRAAADRQDGPYESAVALIDSLRW